MTSDASEPRPDTSAEFAAKLNKLFETMHPRGQEPPSNYAVARGIELRSGISITPQYISQLRTGRKSNPSIQHIHALADYFGVSAAYFFNSGDSERIDSELELLRAMRDAGVRDIAARAFGLSPKAMLHIAAVIDGARALEQLPPLDPPPSSSEEA